MQRSSCLRAIATSMAQQGALNRWRTALTSASAIPMSSSTRSHSRISSRSASRCLVRIRSVTLTVLVIQPDRRRMSGLTDAPVEFGLIPRDHWHQPDWIDETKATASREAMVKNNVIYGGKRAQLLRRPCYSPSHFPGSVSYV